MAASDPFRYEAVRRHVLDMIDSGALRPGDRTPSLRRLSTGLRVSLSTVVEAFARLESEGILEARPKSGFFLRRDRQAMPEPKPRSPQPGVPETLNRAKLIQQVLEQMHRRDRLPMGVARTDERLLPFTRLNRILGQVLRENGDQAAAYEGVLGHEPLRRQIALRGMEAGAELRAGEIMVTSGAMEALHIALRCVTRPGDTVLIASPTYYCFLQLLEDLGLRVIEIPSRPGSGIRPGDVAHAVERFKVATCVLTPNFNNPDGSLLPEEAKAEIVAILAGQGIPLIEDDVYGDIHFTPRRPMICKAFDQAGLVLSCSSFSKTLAPGYRVGWLAPGRFLAKAMEIKATLNVTSATPTQMAVAEYLRAGHYHRHLKRLRPAVQAQMNAVRTQVAQFFPPGTTATRPEGGTVLWVELPGGADSVTFMRRAQEREIGVAPGVLFSSQDRFASFVRLSASLPASPELTQALATLGEIAREMPA